MTMPTLHRSDRLANRGSCTLVLGSLITLALSIPQLAMAADIPPDAAHAITQEVLRSNGDPVGRPLPLAARWTCNNFSDASLTGVVGNKITRMFSLSRVMDDIAAGHRVMPFTDWPKANIKSPSNGYNFPTDEVIEGFRRLAATGMPFELLSGNIEDAMFGKAQGKRPDAATDLWNRPANENPANLMHDVQGTISKPAEVGDVQVTVQGLNPKAVLKKGHNILCDRVGKVLEIAQDVTIDATGKATITLVAPLSVAVMEGDRVIQITRKMDFWSAASPELWSQAGRTMTLSTWGADEALWKRLAEIYPDPPQVQVVSNNEGGGKIGIGDGAASWHAHQRAAEFDNAFPEPRVTSSLRLAFAKGYQEKMGTYHQGIRTALPWKPSSVKLIGYNAFGVNWEVGRWGGWGHDAVPWKQADLFMWLTWDGAAPDFYSYDWNYATDEHVGSPHIGAMQAYTMLSDRAIRQVPDYRWQLAFWDGGQKKRYRYAASRGIPASATVGTIAAAPGNTETNLRIRGAKPGTLVMRQGEMFSIAGHSDMKPAVCTATFDHVVISTRTGEAGAAETVSLTGADIGSVPLPGAMTVNGDQFVIRGSANAWNDDKPDSIFFASQPLAGRQRISARLVEQSNPDRGLVSTEKSAELGETAGHVDVAAKAAQKLLDDKVSGDNSQSRAGLMLRASADSKAPFFAIYRTPSGSLAVMARGATGGKLSILAADRRVLAPAGPVYLAIERSTDGKRMTALWSVDGNSWKSLHEQACALGDKPLAGLIVSAWNNPVRNFRMYTAKLEVIADTNGEATIPVAVFDRGGPIFSNERLPPAAVGAEVRVHDYMPRYQGMCTMALWISRPRVLREFGWGDFDGQIEAQWKALMRTTDVVWSDPVLTKFWRQGSLVPNPAYEQETGFKHPMNLGTDEKEPWKTLWADQPRFFQLSVGINPPFKSWPSAAANTITNTAPDNENSLIKVWAIAYELGKAPKREWLLIAQSPREDRRNVDITVPGFGPVAVEVQRQGSFYHLSEGQPGVVPVGWSATAPNGR